MKRKVGKRHGRLRRYDSYRIRRGSSLCPASHSGREDTGQMILQQPSERRQTWRPNPVDSIGMTFCERQTCSCRHASGPLGLGVCVGGLTLGGMALLFTCYISIKLPYSCYTVSDVFSTVVSIESATTKAHSKQLAWSEQGDFPGELTLS